MFLPFHLSPQSGPCAKSAEIVLARRAAGVAEKWWKDSRSTSLRPAGRHTEPGTSTPNTLGKCSPEHVWGHFRPRSSTNICQTVGRFGPRQPGTDPTSTITSARCWPNMGIDWTTLAESGGRPEKWLQDACGGAARACFEQSRKFCPTANPGGPASILRASFRDTRLAPPEYLLNILCRIFRAGELVCCAARHV